MKMTGTIFARIAILAALPLLFLHQLPPAAGITAIAFAGLVLWWTTLFWLRIAGIALLMFAWMLGAGQTSPQQKQPAARLQRTAYGLMKSGKSDSRSRCSYSGEKGATSFRRVSPGCRSARASRIIARGNAGR